MVFLANVAPQWEDKANRRGGHLQYALKKSVFESQPGLLDELWNNLILALVGGTLDDDLMGE